MNTKSPEISSGLVVVAWSYISPLGTVRKLQDRSPCLNKPEEHHWTPLVRLSDAEAIITKQAAALKLAREAIDWCVAEINRDSPSVVNGRKAISAIDALGE